MGDGNEFYVAPDERDPERLEGILRHSSRRQDGSAPVMLVQLPDSNSKPAGSEFPLRQRRVTIVNMASTIPDTLEEKVDPFEWYFRRNTPNLRTTLDQEGGVDELTSQRKSRIGGNPMEQANIMVTNQVNSRDPIDLNASGANGQTIGNQCLKQSNNRRGSQPKAEEAKLQRNNLTVNNIKFEGKTLFREIDNHDDPPAALDVIMNSLKNYNKEITVFPAQYSSTEQKSPFQKEKERDERSRRPSSRVRVLLMLDEWDEDDRLEDERRKKGQAKGDGRRGRERNRRGGPDGRGESSYTSSSSDGARREYISDKSPLSGKQKDRSGGGKRSDDEGDNKVKGSKRKRSGEEDDKGGRGRKPGRYGDDSRSRDGSDRDGSGRKPGRYGDESRSRDGSDRDGSGRKSGYGDDKAGKRDKSKEGKRPLKHDKKKYSDESSSRGESDSSGRKPGDKRDKSKEDKRPLKRDQKKYGDKSRSRDRSDGGLDDDYRDSKGTTGKDKRGKGKPEEKHDPSQYREVSMPKSATYLTTRRRYHLQVTDHNMKEPWFNSCFNISKENNVDFNYEGPVKITPYYIGDKFT